jgi:hypothetical protein
MRKSRFWTICIVALGVTLSAAARAEAPAPSPAPSRFALAAHTGRWNMSPGEKLLARGEAKCQAVGRQWSQAKQMCLAAITSRFLQLKSLLSRDPGQRAQAAQHGAEAARGGSWAWRYLKQAIKGKITAPFDRLRGNVTIARERIRAALLPTLHSTLAAEAPPAQIEPPNAKPDPQPSIVTAAPKRISEASLLKALGGAPGQDLRTALTSFVANPEARALRPRTMTGIMTALGADPQRMVGSGRWGANTVKMGDRVTVDVAENLEGRAVSAQHTGIVLDVGSAKRGRPALVGVIKPAGQFSTMQFSPAAVTKVTVTRSTGKQQQAPVAPVAPPERWVQLPLGI